MSVDAPLVAAEKDLINVAPSALEGPATAIEGKLNQTVEAAKAAVPAEQTALAVAEPGIAAVLHGNAFDVGPAIAEVKAGYKTTEFWLTTVALALTNFSVVKIPGKYGQAITDAAALAGYALARGLAKLGARPTA